VLWSSVLERSTLLPRRYRMANFVFNQATTTEKKIDSAISVKNSASTLSAIDEAAGGRNGACSSIVDYRASFLYAFFSTDGGAAAAET